MKLIMTADGDQAQRFKFEDDEQKFKYQKHLKYESPRTWAVHIFKLLSWFML